MASMTFTEQRGNGGAAVKSGSHASQKSAGAGGGAAAGVDQQPLGASTEAKISGGLENDGNLLIFRNDGGFDTNEIKTGGAKADQKMVQAFSRGEINLQPALVYEVGVGGGADRFSTTYRAIDRDSARLIASVPVWPSSSESGVRKSV